MFILGRILEVWWEVFRWLHLEGSIGILLLGMACFQVFSTILLAVLVNRAYRRRKRLRFEDRIEKALRMEGQRK